MGRTNLLMGRFETADRLVRGALGDIVRASRDDGAAEMLFLARSELGAEVERRLLEELAGRGVPVGRPHFDESTGAVALFMDIPADATPLRDAGPLPPALLRAGLTTLLTVLSRAHARGRVHSAVDRGRILFSQDGRFWLTDWGAAPRVDDTGPTSDAFTDVARDVRALGMAFVRALLALPPSAEGPEPAPSVSDLAGHGADRDFRRVLARLVAPHPCDAYSTAGEVLADLDEPDTLDPWRVVPLVEPAGLLTEVSTRLSRAADDRECAGLAILGPSGSGRTRVLEWLAAALRARGAVVVVAEAVGPGWGGVGSIVRQLTAMVGRGSRVWSEHEATIRDIVDRREPPTEARFDEAVSAVAALATEAFRSGPGALLLDDVDRLSPMAEEAWHAAARRVESGGAPGLFVFTTATARRGHEGETVTLPEWGAPEVERYLAGVLEDLSLAPALARLVVRVVGGRPNDVIGMLRDLETAGHVARVGARLRVDAPLLVLESWSPDERQDVRRALAAAGRDAADLVDALAVSGEALSREDCVRLVDLPGPRLWAAAERAENAGLLRRLGTRWELRSERIRRRVLASMSAAKRRSFHRELLAMCGARAPDAVGVLAHHARYAGHPDASALTAAAIERCIETGHFDDAVTHLDEAETLLGEPDWGHSQMHRRAEMLFRAGRLGEADEQLRSIIADPSRPGADAASATVMLAHVLYHSRDFDAVLELPLPEATATPAQLSELRYMRAASHAHIYDVEKAQREARLAAAEWPGGPLPFELEQARLESEYKIAIRTDGGAAGRAPLVAKLRHAARSGRREWFEFDLVRVAASVDADRDASLRVVRRTLELLGDSAQRGRAVRGGAIAALREVHFRERGGSVAADEMLQLLYEQTGAHILVTSGRIRRIRFILLRGASRPVDQRSIVDVGDRASSASRSDAIAWGLEFACSAVRLGLASSVLELYERRADRLARGSRNARWERVRLQSILLWSDPPVDLEAIVAASSAVGAIRADAAAFSSDFCAAMRSTPSHGMAAHRPSLASLLAATAIARPALRQVASTVLDLGDAASASLACRCPSAGHVALACALAIWVGGDLEARDWSKIEAHCEAYDGVLFPSLRWRAALTRSLIHWRAGRLQAATESCVAAIEAANWLADERFGEFGRRECGFALRTIAERTPGSLRSVTQTVGSPERSAPPSASAAFLREVAPPAAANAGIIEQFEHALRVLSDRVSLSPVARIAVDAYSWPGGEREINVVAARVAESAVGPVTPELLANCGVGPARDGAALTLDDPAVRCLAGALVGGDLASVGDLERATSLPRRTVQRKLRQMVEIGAIRRTGQGRAVRYTARLS